MARIDEQLDAIDTKLSEAATEIPQLIQDLRDALGEASPEIQAKLDTLTAKAQGLADIVPNATQEPPIDPETPTEGGEEVPAEPEA